MRKIDDYLTTIDTMYPDGYRRESLFRDAGDMLDARPVETPAGNWLVRGLRAYLAWQNRRDGRMALRELTDDMLEDIGLTRQQARAEVRKSFFWD